MEHTALCILAIAYIIAVTITDLKDMKIPNEITIPTMVLAFAIQLHQGVVIGPIVGFMLALFIYENFLTKYFAEGDRNIFLVFGIVFGPIGVLAIMMLSLTTHVVFCMSGFRSLFFKNSTYPAAPLIAVVLIAHQILVESHILQLQEKLGFNSYSFF